MKIIFNFARLIALLVANKSASFANIVSYTTSTGKVYKNLRINLNVNTNRLKKEFLTKVIAFDLKDFDFKNEPVEKETLQLAYDEVLQSAKNALLPYEKKNNRAKAQINAYDFIEGSKSIAKCDGTQSIKLFGTFISGEVIEQGTPKSLGKAQKTRYKALLKRQIGEVIRLPWTLEKVQNLNCFKEELNFG